jgi:putative oxidoreductase
MQNVSKLYYPIGRALLGALFFISGIAKITGFSYVAGWMAGSGVPAANLLLAITIGIEVGGGLMLITGYRSRWAAIAIALFLVPVTLVFHGFWNADAAGFQNQLTQFLKNLAILGGMLLVIEREQSSAERKPAAPSVLKTSR